MLFILTFVILVIGIVFVAIGCNRSIGCLPEIGGVLTFIASIALFVMGIILCLNQIGVDGEVASYQARYESLTYQYENDIYDNDNDLGKRDLMEDIQKWNQDLAWYKENQDDFWIGIFIPNIYNQFNFIELKGE